MGKRLIAAALGFVGGGLLSMILLALIVSIFHLAFQSMMPAALIVGLFAESWVSAFLIYGLVCFGW